MDFNYKALNTDSSVVTGSLSAENIRQAARSLQRQGLKILKLEEVQERASSGFRFSRKVKNREITIFLHQLCVLLESGVAMDEAVESLQESAGHPSLSKQCKKISTSLRRGLSFSAAIAESGIYVPSYFYSLIEAGELTGHLAQALRDGLNQWQYELETRKKLIHSMTYPGILIVSGVVAVLLIFTIVVPRFVKVLEKSTVDIPFLARFVLGSGKFLNENFTLLILFLVSCVIAAVLGWRNRKVRQHIWDFLAKLPLIGQWIREVDMGRWAAMLATLLENKVDLIKSLEIARRDVSVTLLKSQFSSVVKSVRSGVSLAQSLKESRAIDATGFNLIRVGEQSGELSAMLRSFALLMDESIKNRMQRFLLLIEPAAILIIGAVIGVIMAGIIQAITSVNDISI